MGLPGLRGGGRRRLLPRPGDPHGLATLEVVDDGAGFPTTTYAADPIGDQLRLNHFGLASMRQQIEMAGGTWQVRSRPGQGTTLTATLPMAPNAVPAAE